MSDSSKDETIEIEVFKQKYNLLKNKLGAQIRNNEEGFLAEESIEEADNLIKDLCANCAEEIKTELDKLTSTWNEMKDMPAGEKRNALGERIYTTSHEIKDIGSLCGYTLAAYFAESLRDYIAETALNLENQRIIIQAHVDAINTVLKADIKEDGGPEAEELKKMVKVAIEKYN